MACLLLDCLPHLPAPLAVHATHCTFAYATHCSVDDGTLTRTMKPRRDAIFKKYATEVARLESHLR
jgi:hypothetical protein